MRKGIIGGKHRLMPSCWGPLRGVAEQPASHQGDTFHVEVAAHHRRRDRGDGLRSHRRARPGDHRRRTTRGVLDRQRVGPTTRSSTTAPAARATWLLVQGGRRRQQLQLRRPTRRPPCRPVLGHLRLLQVLRQGGQPPHQALQDHQEAHRPRHRVQEGPGRPGLHRLAPPVRWLARRVLDRLRRAERTTTRASRLVLGALVPIAWATSPLGVGQPVRWSRRVTKPRILR